tara:strand:- start:304 stop:1254 length:951 start_codon:yes stop_codon:yes gene_type:complete
MTDKEESGRCVECNSTDKVRGMSHYECAECGCLLDPLELDPGFTPQPFSQTFQMTSNKNGLGTTIGPSKDPKSERWRKAHDRATLERPLFVDLVIREITRSCGNNRISADAADLVLRVNSAARISRVRRRMHGTAGMAPLDSKSYRTRVYAAAALHIRRSDGQVNTAHRVSTDWGINHFDLVAAIRMMNSVLREISPNRGEDPTTMRIRGLNAESEVIRQFLNQLFSIPQAVLISETQIRILRESGEPFYHGDGWNNGRFTNEKADKASFMSTVEAMAELGIPFSSVEELYGLHPVRGLQTRVKRSRKGLFDQRGI